MKSREKNGEPPPWNARESRASRSGWGGGAKPRRGCDRSLGRSRDEAAADGVGPGGRDLGSRRRSRGRPRGAPRLRGQSALEVTISHTPPPPSPRSSPRPLARHSMQCLCLCTQGRIAERANRCGTSLHGRRLFLVRRRLLRLW
jgi:hypothetical protein